MSDNAETIVLFDILQRPFNGGWHAIWGVIPFVIALIFAIRVRAPWKKAAVLLLGSLPLAVGIISTHAN